jgi:hypothetical protein
MPLFFSPDIFSPDEHSLMSLMKRQLIACLTAGIMFASVGCGSGTKAAKTEQVEGLVTLDGQPVPDATVTFVPVQDGVGAAAAGRTDAEGKYRLTALVTGAHAEGGAGTLPGEYYVGVMKVSLPPPPTSEDAVGPSKQRPRETKLTHVVPEKYNDPKKSEIKVTVKEGKNDIPIPLTSK